MYKSPLIPFSFRPAQGKNKLLLASTELGTNMQVVCGACVTTSAEVVWLDANDTAGINRVFLRHDLLS